MKKVVFLLSFLAFVLADENDWLNQWTNPSNEPKASQSGGIKSVAYYKQNKVEAERVLQDCVKKAEGLFLEINKMPIEEQVKISRSEPDFGKFITKKLGKTFWQNCENAENALK